MGITSREPDTVRGTVRRPHFSRAFISVTVQLLTQVFWVISVYFNIRNTLPKSGTFLLGHPVYISDRIFISWLNHFCWKFFYRVLVTYIVLTSQLPSEPQKTVRLGIRDSGVRLCIACSRLTSRPKWDLRSLGILRCVEW